MAETRDLVDLDKEKKKQPVVKPGFSWPSWGQIKWSILLYALLTLAFFALGGLIGGLEGVWKDAGEFFLDWVTEKTWWMTGIKSAAPIASLLVTVIVNVIACYNWSALFTSVESSKPDEGKKLEGSGFGKKAEDDLASTKVVGGTPAPKSEAEQVVTPSPADVLSRREFS